MASTASSTIRAWLADEEGGPRIRQVLGGEQGFDEQRMAPVLDLPLQQLVEMSRGQLSQAAVDGLVRDVDGGTVPEEEPDAGRRERERRLLAGARDERRDRHPVPAGWAAQ